VPITVMRGCAATGACGVVMVSPRWSLVRVGALDRDGARMRDYLLQVTFVSPSAAPVASLEHCTTLSSSGVRE